MQSQHTKIENNKQKQRHQEQKRQNNDVDITNDNSSSLSSFFDVKLSIHKDYMVAGRGYLQNPLEVGHGYENQSKKLKLPKGDKLTWHFKAPNVHDFMWAADPEFQHDVLKMDNGIDLHFYYKKNLEEKYQRKQ